MAQSKEERIRLASEEIIGKGDFALVDEVFAADYVAHAGDKTGNGPGFVRRFGGQMRTAIPDLHVVAVDVLAQSGDTITWSRTLAGTHTADLMGIPPSGKTVKWIEMVVSRFDGERIAEEWVVSELAGELMLKQPRA
ncbi:MAG: ester cyclase [Planctomycetota bacterium]|jgi:predicted ester cyclase